MVRVGDGMVSAGDEAVGEHSHSQKAQVGGVVSEVGVSEVLGAQQIGAPRHGGSERGVS